MNGLSLVAIDKATAGRIGRFDIPCPLCGPDRRFPPNRRRPVLRVWRLDEGFAGFHCVRCGARGSTRDRSTSPPDPAKLARARAEALERERDYRTCQLRKARWLWRTACSACGTAAETYLRSRGITCSLPNTVRFLWPRKPAHHPAMICPCGLPSESAPGILKIIEPAIFAVHLTFLKSDGSDKAAVEDDESDKITVGSPCGRPLVLAPMNDLLGLAIAEGIEDALSVHQETGLGAWAAGSASFLPALAAFVPTYADCITVIADDDDAGRRGARDLTWRLNHRRLHVELFEAAHKEAAA